MTPIILDNLHWLVIGAVGMLLWSNPVPPGGPSGFIAGALRRIGRKD